jgi:hypothetical protein
MFHEQLAFNFSIQADKINGAHRSIGRHSQSSPASQGAKQFAPFYQEYTKGSKVHALDQGLVFRFSRNAEVAAPASRR